MTKKLSLEEYLESIKNRFTGDFSDNGKYNPNSLALDRTGYELHYSKTIGPFAVKGGETIDSKAQEIERQHLNRLYTEVRENPNNPEMLFDFAERLVDNSYDELAEEIMGGILMLQPDNPKAYHLLAEIHSDTAGYLKENGKIKEAREHSSLAELIAEQGLLIVDQHAGPLIDDIIKALRLSDKEEKFNEYSKKLQISYRVEIKDPEQEAENTRELRKTFSKHIESGLIIDDLT